MSRGDLIVLAAATVIMDSMPKFGSPVGMDLLGHVMTGHTDQSSYDQQNVLPNPVNGLNERGKHAAHARGQPQHGQHGHLEQ